MLQSPDSALKSIIMETYHVRNVEEAVELAYKFKAESTYDWFRGQSQDWPPFSSLARVQMRRDKAETERTNRRIQLFLQWASRTPALKHIVDQEPKNEAFAIMQHHGIPTHYIDFTTDPGVAGFFAADTLNPPHEQFSCIYCLNTTWLMDLWNSMKNMKMLQGCELEPIQIDVSNLWRLQAQHGVFLYSSFDWHNFHAMDRILFPYSGYPSYPVRENIYPTHKSHLEQLLDQYFDVEESAFGNEHLREMIREMQNQGHEMLVTDYDTVSDARIEKALTLGRNTPQHPSWSEENLAAWKSVPSENYHDTIVTPVTLCIKPDIHPIEASKTVGFGIRQLLRSKPEVRKTIIDWTFTGLNNERIYTDWSAMFKSVWNGMRLLPYEDEDVATAIAHLALLLTTLQKEGKTPFGTHQLMSECYGDSFQVEFALSNGSGTRGFCAHASVKNAIRDDIAAILTPSSQNIINDMQELVRTVFNPKLLFVFERFKSMFAREIIPAQIATKRKLLIFNPSELETFGLP